MSTINGQLVMALDRTAAPSRLAMSSPTQMVCWAKAVLRAVRNGWMRERGAQHIAALAALSREMRRRKRVESRVVAQEQQPNPYDPSGRQRVDPATADAPHGDAPPQDYPVMPHHQRGQKGPDEPEDAPQPPPPQQTEDECMDAILAAAETDTATGA